MNSVHRALHFDFSGATVLVSGASGWLGGSIARAFAHAGARVFLHAHRHPEQLESLRRTMPRPEQHRCLVADVTSDKEIRSLIEEVSSLCGEQGLTVLVNNVGIYPVQPLADIEDQNWRIVIETDLSAVHRFTRRALPLLQPGASIINIASIEGERPVYGHAHYAAAKAGLIRYTEASALELGPYGIRVNCISPGLIEREGLAEEWPEGYGRYCRAAPLGRAGAPEEIAAACLFLASDAAGWITGINLISDGGMHVVMPYDPLIAASGPQ